MFQLIDNLIQAIKEQQIIYITYDSWGKEEGKYKILPLHLFEYKGRFYLSAKNLRNNQYQRYKLENIKGLETTFLLIEDTKLLEAALEETKFDKALVQEVNVHNQEQVDEVYTYYGQHAKKVGNSKQQRLFQYYIQALSLDEF